MICVKIHKGKGSEVVAVCDKELIGKKFSDGKLFLDVKKDFYGGEVVDESKLKEILDNAASLNIVGKESIGFALKEKIINESSVIKIKGVPHAQVYSF